MFSFMQKMRSFQRNFSVSPSCPLLPLQLPSPMETHVWFVLPDEFKSVSLLNQYMELLSPCEKENVLTMRGDQLQKRALLARALVRTTIARLSVASVLQDAIVAFWDQINNHVVDPRSLKFRKNFHGKPEIGIDVEEKQRKIKNNILAFARRYFSLYEVEHLSMISDSEVQRQEFVKLWTLKVSLVLFSLIVLIEILKMHEVRSRGIEYVHQLFDEMPEPNVVSWTSLISGYVNMGRPQFPLWLYTNMLAFDFFFLF
ncbi:hypothetical protein DKX38_009957 [Salix brachista]|uniref:holo-[acyl-carrier-protein] synthase n=1 Tax=Salix brachista TaxID=2182728 RepID=A0A5N5MEV2_9ROSI|nr:hypothetical protein DKX38_009957 [Salix brachista]